jgi:hypothetical protein
MGVMLLGPEPVAIVQDTSVNPEQKSVRKGDMFGEYQIGDILPYGVTLLGTAGQQFQIPLRVESASGAVGGGGGPHVPPPPGGAATRPPAPGARPVTARPVPPQRENVDPNAPGVSSPGDQKAMSARERAQAIAQRNAELRKNNQKGGGGGGANSGERDGKPDPVQARLEALRQLREAAKSR